MDKVLETMIANMPEKTGKSREEWEAILATKNYSKHGDAIKFLKEDQGVSHGFANTIAHLAKAEQTNEVVDLVADQYNGKENLLHIFEKLKTTIETFGGDITITPKKASVSFIRKNQFALVQPTTKTRIDLGLKLRNEPTAGILGNSGPFGSMCTHRIQLQNEGDVDAEVVEWMCKAYGEAK